MAGHSKWANIKHKKAEIDTKRSKVWTHLIKEIHIASRLGGCDPSTNSKLRIAIDRASSANIPKENVKRAINRGIGDSLSDGAINYEEIRYEGYGVCGIAIIVDTLTENRFRTVAKVRYAFSKFGGNMTSAGSVTFMFNRVGKFLFRSETNEDILIRAVLEVGACDVIVNDDGSIEILCDFKKFSKIKDILEIYGFKDYLSKVVMIAKKKIELTSDNEQKIKNTLNALESIDEVQEVYTNASIILDK